MKWLRLVGGVALLAVAFRNPLRADYLEEGIRQYKAGNYVEAIRSFEKKLARGTRSHERRTLYLYLGKSYESSGRMDKAIPAYEEALIYDRKNWRRHRDLGGLYENMDLPWKAIDCYKNALRLNPKEASLFLSLGRAYRTVGLYSDAEIWLNKNLAVEPHNVRVLEQLSFLYEGKGRFIQAAHTARASGQPETRVLYLGLLAGDPLVIKECLARLRTSSYSKETRQAYENLVEWLRRPPMEILSGKAVPPDLKSLFEIPFSEGKQ
ncbi:MAG: hypothetical protein KCHDKBKB_01718 [Elusimicrobia bacterium]|nr:hypothetical protein [Elusimicrobiota bacterium]